MWKWAGAMAFGWLVMAGGARADKHVKPAQTAPRVGVTTRVFQPKEVRNWRGEEQKSLRCTIWYPAVDTAVEVQQTAGLLDSRDSPDSPNAALFDAGMASPNAPFVPSLDKFPLVLLSHSEGGSALQMAWLGTALARAGYVAVAPDHPGTNSNGPITVEGMTLWWERAQDLSDVLDGMLADQAFGPHLDKSLVVAAGFSMGGYAVMELAGAQTDIGAFFGLCKDKPDTAVCQMPRQIAQPGGLRSTQDMLHAVRQTSGLSLARSGDSFRDPRVKAVFVIAPVLAFTFTPDSLRAIRLPVEIVAGAEDRIAPAEDNANWIRQNVRGARETVLPGVSHYTFLDRCTAQGAREAANYCADPQGVDRADVHARVAQMAVSFFDHALRLR